MVIEVGGFVSENFSWLKVHLNFKIMRICFKLERLNIHLEKSDFELYSTSLGSPKRKLPTLITSPILFKVLLYIGLVFQVSGFVLGN